MPPRTTISLRLMLGALLVMMMGCGPEKTDNVHAFDAAVGKAKSLADAGKEREARSILQEAAQMPPGRGIRRGDAVLLLGDLYLEAAEFDSARMMYERAVEEFRAQADRRSTYNATLALAGMLRQLGADREAYDLCTESLRLARVFGDKQEELTIQQTLLSLAIALQYREEEEALSSQLTKIARDSSLVAVEAQVLLEVGAGKVRRDEYDAAVQDYLRTIALAEQIGDSSTAASALLRLAGAFDAAGRSKEALDTYGTAVRRLNAMTGAFPTRLETLIRIGNHYLREFQWIEAERFYMTALNIAASIGNQVAEGYVMVQLGHCLFPRSREEGVQRYQQALRSFQAVQYARGSAYAYHALARSSETMGRYIDAVDYYKKSIAETDLLLATGTGLDVFEECEQLLAGGRLLSAYDNVIALLLQVGKEDEAFWYLERKNEKTVCRSLSAMELQAADPSQNRILSELTHARAVCVGAERQLRRVLETKPHHTNLLAGVLASLQRKRREFTAQCDRVRGSAPQFTPAVQFDGLSPSQVQSQLGPEEALVCYALTPRSTYAFVTTRLRTSVHIGISGQDRIVGIAEEYLDDLQRHIAWVDSGEVDRHMPAYRLQELTRSLYESLVLPIEPAIRGSSQVRVVLPSGLTSISVHALQRRGALSLAERAVVSYLPAARWLTGPPVKHAPVTTVAALGHAGSTSWDVEYELRDIRAFYKDAQLFFNKQATLSTLQGMRTDLLHLALDVTMSERVPGTSYVLLSDGQSATSTSRVSAGKLVSCAPAGTVILSNLAASIRPLQASLPALILATGTPLVITNGIPSARKAKKVFGEMYYTGLVSGLSSPAAFRKAQMEMARDKMYAAPQYWAPFMLWGR